MLSGFIANCGIVAHPTWMAKMCMERGPGVTQKRIPKWRVRIVEWLGGFGDQNFSSQGARGLEVTSLYTVLSVIDLLLRVPGVIWGRRGVYDRRVVSLPLFFLFFFILFLIFCNFYFIFLHFFKIFVIFILFFIFFHFFKFFLQNFTRLLWVSSK